MKSLSSWWVKVFRIGLPIWAASWLLAKSRSKRIGKVLSFLASAGTSLENQIRLSSLKADSQYENLKSPISHLFFGVRLDVCSVIRSTPDISRSPITLNVCIKRKKGSVRPHLPLLPSGGIAQALGHPSPIEIYQHLVNMFNNACLSHLFTSTLSPESRVKAEMTL